MRAGPCLAALQRMKSMLAFYAVIRVTVKVTNALFLLPCNCQRRSAVQVDSATVDESGNQYSGPLAGSGAVSK